MKEKGEILLKRKFCICFEEGAWLLGCCVGIDYPNHHPSIHDDLLDFELQLLNKSLVRPKSIDCGHTCLNRRIRFKYKHRT